MSATTEQIQKHPVREAEEAQAMLVKHAELMAESAALMAEPLSKVSLEDKRHLIVEMRVALMGMTACVNLQAMAEIEMKKQVRTMEEKWGWML